MPIQNKISSAKFNGVTAREEKKRQGPPTPYRDTTTLTEISSRKFDTSTLAVALSPDGSQFAISFADAPVLFLMDSTSGEVRSSFHVGADGMISKVAFASDGRWIATGTRLGVVRLWDTTVARSQ